MEPLPGDRGHALLVSPQAQVRIVPPPVRAAFRTPPSRARARDTLGIPARARCVLVMSGGWGLGPVA